MAMAKLFKSSIPNMFMILSSGTKAEFINGMYYTTDEDDAVELNKEIKRGIAGIWVDPNEPEIDTDAVTPYEQLKKKIREELLSEMVSASAHTNDRGTYGTGDTNDGIDKDMVTTTQFVEGAKLSVVDKAPAPATTTPTLLNPTEVRVLAGLAAKMKNNVVDSNAAEPEEVPKPSTD